MVLAMALAGLRVGNGPTMWGFRVALRLSRLSILGVGRGEFGEPAAVPNVNAWRRGGAALRPASGCENGWAMGAAWAALRRAIFGSVGFGQKNYAEQAGSPNGGIW